MTNPQPTRTDYNNAIAERDYLLKFFEELGVALCKGRPLGFHGTADGVEVCMLYPSRADAAAAAGYMRTLRAMVTVAGLVHWRREARARDREARRRRRIGDSSSAAIASASASSRVTLRRHSRQVCSNTASARRSSSSSSLSGSGM
jgi:hypothetical protein